ncbi:hypothetical protein K1719_033325 [Acacia pycnantha]|nr:hypothetical protein K1719_033325 [Acacia pycnantha]
MFEIMIPDPPTTFEHQNLKKPRDSFLSLVLRESHCIAEISLPMVFNGLLLYSRPLISMLFLGRFGKLALVGGSLALASLTSLVTLFSSASPWAWNPFVVKLLELKD